MSICADTPRKSVTLSGGANDATSVNGGPLFESHANVFTWAPASPQSSHDKLIPGWPIRSGPTWKLLSEVADPPGTTTVIGPSALLAILGATVPLGTGAWIVESFSTVNAAGTPLKSTREARVKLTPRIVIT